MPSASGTASRPPPTRDCSRTCASTGIPLEVCPTSNVCTRSVASLAEHPLPALVAAGVPVPINSDDPPMFSTTLNHEYAIAAELLGLDPAGVAELARAAVRASFLDGTGPRCWPRSTTTPLRRARPSSPARINLGHVPDPSSYRPAPGSIPLEPGVYRFRDERGRVIYVGKAKSLRQRLNSYFADISALHPRTRQMVTSAASVEWTVVRTEVEALQLEYTWIKEFDPRFNVRYRDDKSYPSLAVTLYEEFPRLQVMRGPKRKGVRYFGPYSHAWAIRETLDLLLRVFPARTCSAGVFKRAGQVGRPCLLGYIGKCSAPCVGRVTADEHRAIVDDFCDFMAGRPI